ncbi:glycosyltransferase family 39 protein [candidate division WOR-3 bacterium]|nr:glycosyltransferase family 39 protein [candidate division WOR-3 bacterium]
MLSIMCGEGDESAQIDLTKTETAGKARSSNWVTIFVMAVLALTVLIIANTIGGYGYFRDELYYIACSKHLDAGYVDQPPLSIFVLAVACSLFGDSVFAIRLVPAILFGVSVALTGILARRMGGGRASIVLASLALLAAPQMLSLHTYFSMNSLDVMFWLLAVHALIGAAESARFKAWIWLGFVLGLGLLNKTSVLWLGAGVSAVILFDRRLRFQLKTPGPYAAAAVALAIFSPFVIWNALNGWPHIEFMRNALEQKYSSLTRWRFVVDQFWGMNPFTYLVSLPGLVWCFTHKDERSRRLIGIMFLTVFGVLIANSHTKSEYIVAAYPMIFACGGVCLGTAKFPWRWGVPTILVLSGAVLAPFAIPILPVNLYLSYSKALGVAPNTPENQELGDLPQFFADMHGWEELAQNVSKAYVSIPDTERATTVVFVTNYGEAGALELYAHKYLLPRVICNHNSYWFWGVGPMPVTTFIRLGGNREDYFESYGDVMQAGLHTCMHCMPEENNLKIFIVRDRHVPIDRAWAEYKHFE